MRVKFWQKTLAALLVVGVLPIAFVNAVSIQGTRDRLTELGVTNIRERAVSTANAIDSYLQGPLGDVVLVSKLPAVIAYAQNVNDPDLRRAAREVLAAASARSVNYESIAIVSIDPHQPQEGLAVVPASLGLPPSFTAHDLLADERYQWRIGPNYVRLVPGVRQAHVIAVDT